MSGELSVRNHQRVCIVNVPLLRRIARWLLVECLGLRQFNLSVQLVGEAMMAQLNEKFLQHEGSTDVITFDYGEVDATELHGEIVICLDDALKQAREFRTTHAGEVTRYLIHGLLHLRGHDDLNSAARKKMKREEDRLLREAARYFSLADLMPPRRRQKISHAIKAAAPKRR